MEEHTIAVVASNLTAAYYAHGAPHEGPGPTGDTDAGRFTAVLRTFAEFEAALRERVHQEYERAQREAEQEQVEDADKPVQPY